MVVNPGRHEKQREEKLTALSCGAGENNYEYNGLQEEQNKSVIAETKSTTPL